MTSKTLDRSKRFGWIYGGDTGALYTQGGLCFNGAGEHVPQPGEAAAPEVKAAPEAKAAPAPAGEPGAVTREQLEELHISQLKKLVIAEELELETGPGSKARNIDNLLAAAQG